MFGPGLETGTSRIVRKILHGDSDLFTVVSMFPGQFGGNSLFIHLTVKNVLVCVVPLRFFVLVEYYESRRRYLRCTSSCRLI